MKFKYAKLSTKDGTFVYRPIIPIAIASQAGTTQNYYVLVDSGADECIFDADIGEAIGLDVKSGKLKEAVGIGGKKIKVYFHDIFISVGGHELPIKCGFSFDMNKSGFGILGQLGFFDRFKKVIFDYNKKIIELRLG